MQEQIYTIPVSEAYDADCECPFCLLEKNLEKSEIEYALGASMMEPDSRMESNSKGFCNKHFSMLYAYPNRLSLALVLDTHLEDIRSRIKKFSSSAKAIKNGSAPIFKKSDSAVFAENISHMLNESEKGCVVCEKINYTMSRYYDVALHLWAGEPEFRKKFKNSKGVCLPHFKILINSAVKHLNKKQAGEFISELYDIESAALSRIQEDIHKFTLKFDYRNTDMEWGTAKDAPIRTVEKIIGYIQNQD